MSFEIAIATFLAATYGLSLQAELPADLPLVHREPTPPGYDPRTEVVLVLADDRRFVGLDVEREGDLYLLEIEGGTVLSIPAAGVKEVGLKLVDQPATAFRPSRAGELQGGTPARLPEADEQLAEMAAGRAEFQTGVVDPNWEPSSDWSNDPALNNFNPSRWYRAPLDPAWSPTSDFTLESDVTEFSPARWMPSVIDPSWTPTDGYELRRRFWERLAAPVEP